jgi:hypothetical protein
MDMKARISRPDKTATQSGRGRTGEWLLEYEPVTSRAPESLMGWSASGDTTNQVRLKFDTLEEAKSFAEKKGMAYVVGKPHERRVKPRNYGDNFRYIPEEKK